MTIRLTMLIFAGFVLAAGSAAAQGPTGVPQDLFRDDVHARAGVTCETCHGSKVAGSYPTIERTKIAPLCATCHANAATMRQTKSDYPIDQFAQYLTSMHGKQMTKGETRVATCTDCHGTHGIRPVDDPKSPVALRNIATTCARCHSDSSLMTAFKHEDNPPEDWKASVHAAALLQRGDTSAPTCSTCHSSHGATRPGVATMPMVCAECHVREADLYKNSPKKAAFDHIDEPGCLTCHSNHRIEQPSDSFVGLKNPALCSACHDDAMKGAAAILEVQQGLGRLTTSINRAQQVLDRAVTSGMLVDDGLLALHDAREQQVLARVTVHAFAAKPFTDIATKGVASAARAEQIGNQAMQERQFRREGLAVATFFILGFLITLWIKIRRLPPIEG